MANNTIVQHKDADVIHWTATAGKTVGTLVLVSQYVGVCQITATTGAVIPVQVAGIATLTKPTGVAWAQGDEVYWTGSALTQTDTSNNYVGLAWAAATSGAGLNTLKVHLKGAGVNALTI